MCSQMQKPNPFETLHVEGLVKKMDHFTLKAHFSVKPGERVALSGKSGSGKTTLLRVLAGLEPLNKSLDQGKIFLGKTELTTLPVQKREIGFVFQDQALFEHLNVFEKYYVRT